MLMIRIRCYWVCLVLFSWAVASGAYGQDNGDVTNALYLNGGYVVLPSTIIDGLTSATIEAWVKWENFNNWSRVFDFGREGKAVFLANEKITSILTYTFYLPEGKNEVKFKEGVSQNVWHHIALVSGARISLQQGGGVSYEARGMQLYIDGSLIVPKKNPLIGFLDEMAKQERKKKGEKEPLPFLGSLKLVSGGDNYIGKSNWEGDELFNGYIAEFRIWNTARTAQEIKSTMNSQLSGEEPGLVGYWRFDQAEGIIVKDLTGKGNDGRLEEGASIVNIGGPPINRVWTAKQKQDNDIMVKSKAEHDKGKLEEAISSWMKITEKSEYFQNAQSYIKEAQTQIAVQKENHYKQGKEAYAKKDWKGTIDNLSKLGSEIGNYPDAQKMLSSSYFKLGNQAYLNKKWSEAVELLSKVDSSSANYKSAKLMLEHANLVVQKENNKEKDKLIKVAGKWVLSYHRPKQLKNGVETFQFYPNVIAGALRKFIWHGVSDLDEDYEIIGTWEFISDDTISLTGMVSSSGNGKKPLNPSWFSETKYTIKDDKLYLTEGIKNKLPPFIKISDSN